MSKDIEQHDLRTFNLITTLLSIINENAEGDINVFLARHMLNNITKLKQKSIYDVADECYTSRSTVQRFIKTIGFDSCQTLKSKIDEAIEHNNRFKKFYGKNNFRETYLADFYKMTQSIDKICDSKTMDYFVELIHISNHVVFTFAENSTIAPRDFQEAMIQTGKSIRIVTNCSKSIDFLNSLNEKDTLITLSVTGNYAIATFNDIKKVNANKILITLNRYEGFHEIYDKVIYLSEEAVSADYIQSGIRNAYTIYGLSYLLDLMLNKYFEKHVL